MPLMNTIGLFGTCGGSKWREPFIAEYQRLGIPYFNPQVDDWRPELADIEARHLKEDRIILFPVTSETYGTGSLAETGFSILKAVENARRWTVVMIADDIDVVLQADDVAYKESLRARRLVKAHLAKLNLPNVFTTTTFDDMLALSVKLYDASTTIDDIEARFRKVA